MKRPNWEPIQKQPPVFTGLPMEHVVIIGNGIAGVTAARHIRKLSNKKITIISAEADHFFSRTALMYVYMGHMRWKDIEPYEQGFWKKNRLELKRAYVSKIDTDAKMLLFKEGGTMQYDTLIIASGSTTNTFGWEGLDSKGVVGMVTKQDLEHIETYAPNNNVCQRAVLVGGGLIGVELAEMLRTRNIEVTFLIREENFWNGVLPEAEAAMISRHVKSHGVDLRNHANLNKIVADKEGNVRAIVVKETGEEIPCSMVGICTGVKPNISFLEGTGIQTDRGILVNRKLETNVKNIYAIGDCAQQHQAIGNRKPVEAVWYTGRMMGETVAQTICGNPFEYNPGYWFNSAKFFDIEYQTYGWVFSDKKDYEAHFHWHHKDDIKCITIAYHKETQEFLGINTFGIRMKHEVFDQWLSQHQKVDYVVQHLKEANFDPEFYTHFEKEIQTAFQQHQPVNA